MTKRQVSSMGGRAAHQKGTAHEFTVEEARAAGRKGGLVVSKDRDHMSRIGQIGGRASRENKKKGILFENLAPEVQKILEEGNEG
jgi:uncharacterized protein